MAYANSMYLFSKFVRDNKITGLNIQSIITSAEVLHDYERKLIEDNIQTQDIKTDSDMTWAEKNILIAEDEESNFILIKEILKKTGIKIIRARDGIEAVKMANQNKALDLILMDVQMPGINGYEATRKIRQLNINIPVIAQTAYAMSGEREISLGEGCNDYISKPIRAQELLYVIGKFLNSKI